MRRSLDICRKIVAGDVQRTNQWRLKAVELTMKPVINDVVKSGTTASNPRHFEQLLEDESLKESEKVPGQHMPR